MMLPTFTPAFGIFPAVNAFQCKKVNVITNWNREFIISPAKSVR